jgi:methylated-DNA-[protein]-cysteine S-methyltransferase
MSSTIGRIYLTASAKGLRGVFLTKQAVPMAPSLRGNGPGIRTLARAARQIEEYLAGRRKQFAVPLDAAGTPFQRSVWRQLAKIPYGRTCSYRDIARRIKNVKAVRAVGGANGSNPLCIIVPCHRVIAADGTIGGYSGGIAIKKKLLRLELSGAL